MQKMPIHCLVPGIEPSLLRKKQIPYTTKKTTVLVSVTDVTPNRSLCHKEACVVIMFEGGDYILTYRGVKVRRGEDVRSVPEIWFPYNA